MYAVIETGGKQYRVELGTEIRVDRLDVQPGDSIMLDRVLLVADGDRAAIGRPLVDGATVRADVIGQTRGKKVVVFKYRPKARRRVKRGFRAELTALRVSEIAFGGRSAADAAAEAALRGQAAIEQAAKAAAARAAEDQALAVKLAAAAARDSGEGATAAGARAPRAAARKRSAPAAPGSAADGSPASDEPAEAAAEGSVGQSAGSRAAASVPSDDGPDETPDTTTGKSEPPASKKDE